MHSLNHLLETYIYNEENKKQHLLSTGFKALDNKIRGFYETELVVVGGRPGMGKTQLLVEMALRMSNEAPVVYYSLCQTEQLIVERFSCAVQGYIEFGINISKQQLFIYSLVFNTYEEFEQQCQNAMKEHNVKIIMIDYLQLMFSSPMESINEDGNFVMSKLKEFARRNDICIIVAAQLNRESEYRSGHEGKKPQLSDLCTSGAIEQQADKVILIHRPAYYKIWEDEKGNDISQIMELNVAKNRNGKQISLNMQIANNKVNILDNAILF